MKTNKVIQLLTEERHNLSQLECHNLSQLEDKVEEYVEALNEAIYALKSWLAIQTINNTYRCGDCTADHYYHTLAAIIADMIKESEGTE